MCNVNQYVTLTSNTTWDIDANIIITHLKELFDAASRLRGMREVWDVLEIVLLQDDRGFLDEHLYIEDDWLF